MVMQNSGSKGVHEIVVQVGDGVGDSAYLAFEGQTLHEVAFQKIAPGFGVHEDALPHLPCEVQSVALFLQLFDDAQALMVVPETSGVQRCDFALADVTERSMSKVVPQRNSLGEVFVEVEGARDGSGYLGYFEGVGESGYKVVALGRDEHLSLVFQASEGIDVKDAVPVSLELGADGRGSLCDLAANT